MLGGPKPTEHIEYLIDIVHLLRFMLLSLEKPPTAFQIDRMHLFSLLRVVISQAIDIQSHTTIATPRQKDNKEIIAGQ